MPYADDRKKLRAMSDLYARVKARGLCWRCRTPAGGGILCPGCREKSRANQRRRAETLRAAGACHQCKRHSGPKRYCVDCLAARNRVRRAKKEAARDKSVPRPARGRPRKATETAR